MAYSKGRHHFPHPHRKLCFILLGMMAYALMLFALPTPDGMTEEGKKTAALLVLMVIWWLSEAAPLPVTALLPLVLLPLSNISPIAEAARSYADPVVFLYLGGFIIAIAMEKWHLHRRIALHIISWVGTNANFIIGGFMVATAFLSMWISNTATTLMMLPIALSVTGLLHQRPQREGEHTGHFNTALLLGLAYASSIGGITTLIGTAPNAIFAGFVQNTYGVTITFIDWMMVAFPLAVLLLLFCWWFLTRIYPNKMGNISGITEMIEKEITILGAWTKGEKLVAFVFTCTALLWMSHSLISNLTGITGLSDATVALLGALILFLLPVSAQKAEMVLDWKDAEKLPWGILLLFGGGLSLAAAIRQTGLAEWMGGHFHGLTFLPELALLLLVVGCILVMTEFMSNVATITTFLPVIAAIAAGTGMHPLTIMIPATIAASCAFMMPVATPPNAVVFASGHIRIAQMVKAGVWLNLFTIAVVPLFCYWMIGYVFTP